MKNSLRFYKSLNKSSINKKNTKLFLHILRCGTKLPIPLDTQKKNLSVQHKSVNTNWTDCERDI